jgi:ferredoxin
VQDLDLLTLRDRHLDFARSAGANAVGVCDTAALAGGPPSTDLTRELEGARSAIVFSFPLDEEPLEKYMGKIDHGAYQAHYIQLNNLVAGVASELAHSLRGFGYQAVPVYAGNTPSGGDHRDVNPQNDYQREMAERYPAKPSDLMMGSVPVLSQRHLAAAAGVGFFGMSGNILTQSHGAAVVLGATVTTAELPPTPVLPPEANYCDECNWCGSVCPTKFMSREDFTSVQMGEHDHHKYSTRLHHARCGMHMMGVAGLAEDGTWGSWGPGRKSLPDDDDKLLPIVMEMAVDTSKRPETPGGFVFPQQEGRTNIMCSACNLVCHPKREVRAKRVKMWRQGGVSVQHEDGRIESMPAEDARAFLDAMPPERRALYETTGD